MRTKLAALLSNKLFMGPMLVALIIMGISIAHPKQAAAISNVSPAVGTSNGPNNQPWLAVGTGDFNGVTTYVKIYVKNGQAATVTINQGCNLDVGNPRVNYYISTLAADESYGFSSVPVSDIPASGTCSQNPKMTIPAGPNADSRGGVSSNIGGHEGYRVFYLEATITSAPGDNERSFRVSVDGANLVGISRIVKNYGDDASTFGIYQRDASTQQTWNYNQEFAPQCTDRVGGHGIGIYDADVGVYHPQNLRLVLAQATRGSANYTAVPESPWGGSGDNAAGWAKDIPILGGNHDTKALAFSTTDNKSTYKMQWSAINYRNTLQIYVPFDEFDASVGTQSCGASGDVVCNAANASINPVNVNQNSQFTVNIKNNTSAKLDNSYSLRQTYYSSINPTPQTLTRNLSSGPGLLGPGDNGNFSFGISRVAPGTFTFDFQMQQNGNLVGSFNPNCRIVLYVVDTPPRPECYVRFSVNGADQANNAPIVVPYGGSVTIKPQILNSTANTWGPRYFMSESVNGGARQNIGNFVSVGPGAFTGLNPPGPGGAAIRTFNNLTSTTTFDYQVWVTPAGSPSGPAIPTDCSITAFVSQPQVGGSIGGGMGATCKQIGYEVHWTPASGNNIRTIIRTMSGGQHDRDVTEAPGAHSFDPFTDPAFATVPMDQSVTYELYAQNADGSTFTDLGGVTIGPCLQTSCANSSVIDDIEPGETKSITDVGGFSINNLTNRRTVFTMSASIAGGSLSPANPSSSYTIPGDAAPYNIRANSITAGNSQMTLTRTLSYPGGGTSCQQVITPGSKPYLKVYGGDVSVGGWFNDGTTSCASNANIQQGANGGIKTYASANVSGHPYRAGSSSEFAAFALGAIDNNNSAKYGFYGAGANSSATFDLLDFANTGSPDGNLGFSTGAPNTANESCITDYYSDVGTTAPNIGGNINSVPAGGGADTSRIFNHGIGNFSIGGFSLNPGERLTVYAQGDVYITGDITYTGGAANAGSVLDPSYFALIVKGNVYISSGVKNLNGMYVAQPTSGKTDGNIWTCAVSSGGKLLAPTSDQTISSCKQKLVINGSIIAKHVTFNRIGDLNANTLSAVKQSDPETSSFQYFDNGPGSNKLGSNKSTEEINYIPQMAIGSPYLSVGDSSGKLDSVTILPPLF